MRSVSLQAPLVVAPLLAAALLAGGCSVNPATGRRQLTLIGESQEIAMGREADTELVASLGLYPDQEVQDYVSSLGMGIAKASERPDLPWSFRVIDDPVVNAFALPGGFVYITRGILTHFGSEAELISVLGHEIGHVTGKHGVERMSKGQLAQLGLGVGMIVSPEFRQFSDLAQQSLGLLFLKYSRDNEREADDLGLRYLIRADYDPREMPKVFHTLDRISAAATDGGRLPGWLSTHPQPENRVGRISDQVSAMGRDFSGTKVERERFLDQLDGMTFGENPRQGYFKENVFYHPDLAFRIDFPEGWKTANQRQQVAAVSPEQDALVVLSLAPEGPSREAAKKFFAQEGVRQGASLRGRFGGLPAIARAFLADRGEEAKDIAGMAAFVDYGDNTFQILGYTVDENFRAYAEDFESSLESFRRVTDRRILEVQPARMEIVKLPRAMTLEEFSRRYPSNADLEKLAILNQAEPGTRFPAGTRLKRVVGGELP